MKPLRRQKNVSCLKFLAGAFLWLLLTSRAQAKDFSIWLPVHDMGLPFRASEKPELYVDDEMFPDIWTLEKEDTQQGVKEGWHYYLKGNPPTADEHWEGYLLPAGEHWLEARLGEKSWVKLIRNDLSQHGAEEQDIKAWDEYNPWPWSVLLWAGAGLVCAAGVAADIFCSNRGLSVILLWALSVLCFPPALLWYIWKKTRRSKS